MLAILQSSETPLSSGPLTLDEVSWVCSIMSIGVMVAIIVFSWLTDAIGRKYSILLLGPMQIISWALIAFGNNVFCLYVARLLIGAVCGGVMIAVPIFITEISEDR